MENNNFEEKSQKILDSVNKKAKITKYIVYSVIHISVFITFWIVLKDWLAIVFAYSLYLLFSYTTLPKILNLFIYMIHRKDYKELKQEHDQYQQEHSEYLESFFKAMLLEDFYSDDLILNTPIIRLLKKEIKTSPKKSEIKEVFINKFIDILKEGYELIYFQENEEAFFEEYDAYIRKELNSKESYKDIIYLIREVKATQEDLDKFDRMKNKIAKEELEKEELEAQKAKKE